MSSSPRQTRILALDPGTRETGFALLNGDTLIRYGVMNIKRRFEKQSSGNVPGTELIENYKPHVVVLGKLIHPERRKNPVLKNLANQIKRFALRKGIEVQEIEPKEARKFLIKDSEPTKMNSAKLIVAQYPELSSYLPRKGRILWSPKDKYWMNVFDAFTLGLYYIRYRKRGNKTSQDLNTKLKTL